MKPNIKPFSDNPAVAKAFAIDFVELLNQTIEAQGKATVSLSGGSTPKLLFSVLSENFENVVDWRKVHFFWGDERCVPPNDPDSNYGEAERLFLSKIDIPAENIHRVHGESAPNQERARYANEILEYVDRNNDGLPCFDIMLLGMGGDGHTASIFPDAMEFLTSDQICEVATHPESGQLRITVTGKIINASSHVFFLVTGAGKADVLAEIINKTGNFESYPATHIVPVDGAVFYVDQAAAANLTIVS